MSETLKVKVEFRNATSLAGAVTAMGGQVLGQGTHRLYQTSEQGFGFKLPGWRYPLVSRPDGTLAYDDYHGAWGDVTDLEKLKTRYVIETARQAAEEKGWYTEAQDNGSLLIVTPEGGTLTVTPEGVIDAAGFTGSSCAAATEPIARALGATTGEERKAEFDQLKQTVSTTE